EQHLDLPITLQSSLEVAQGELLRINGFKAPRDKLTILYNTTQVVVDLIKKGGASENAGNDHLLPALILVIIRANAPQLISNIKYVMRFRNQAELDKGENQFCLTNLMGAVSYIYNMSIKSLTLTPEEIAKYDKEMPSKDTGATTSSAPQIGQFASKVYSSTSGWFSNFIKDAKVFGEQVTGTVDGFVAHLTSTDETDSPTSPGPPLPPRTSGTSAPSLPARSAAPTLLVPTSTTAGPFSAVSPGPFSAISPSAPSPASPRMMSMSAAERAQHEDYELQLALALSLSAVEGQAVGGGVEGEAEPEETPLERRSSSKGRVHWADEDEEAAVKAAAEVAAGDSGTVRAEVAADPVGEAPAPVLIDFAESGAGAEAGDAPEEAKAKEDTAEEAADPATGSEPPESLI
ncbi:hypothetical protein BDK51DRAFT_32351, partial [Blyttiomyces helicus]